MVVRASAPPLAVAVCATTPVAGRSVRSTLQSAYALARNTIVLQEISLILAMMYNVLLFLGDGAILVVIQVLFCCF